MKKLLYYHQRTRCRGNFQGLSWGRQVTKISFYPLSKQSKSA